MSPTMKTKNNRIRIPKNIDAVTTRSDQTEIDPLDLGLESDATDKIWSSVESMLKCLWSFGVYQ